jgi:hypothetical protein
MLYRPVTCRAECQKLDNVHSGGDLPMYGSLRDMSASRVTQNFQEGIGAAERVAIYSDDRTVHREPVDNPAWMQ